MQLIRKVDVIWIIFLLLGISVIAYGCLTGELGNLLTATAIVVGWIIAIVGSLIMIIFRQ